MSTQKSSIWVPKTKLSSPRDKGSVKICVGHYATNSLKPPTSAMILELSGPEHKISQITKLVPHPVGYVCVWQKLTGKFPIYLWQPIPPTEDSIALGMIATTTIL